MAFQEEPKAPIPAWLVSFGDMMTLILTFFILLVALAPTQDAVKVAKGVGSFEIALRGHGMPGLLSGDEKMAIFDRVRARFGLPPEDDPDRIDASLDAAKVELLRVQSIERMKGSQEVRNEDFVRFEPGSALLTKRQLEAIDRRGAELAPTSGELLLIEAYGDGNADTEADLRLALARARAVVDHLLLTQEFPRSRVQVRVPSQPGLYGPARAGRVDARLLIPLVPR
ncbi:MAG: hypothetical protein RL277_2641 [Planctomycetota bacterium]|jgi:chemotaxis protein MotB